MSANTTTTTITGEGEEQVNRPLRIRLVGGFNPKKECKDCPPNTLEDFFVTNLLRHAAAVLFRVRDALVMRGELHRDIRSGAIPTWEECRRRAVGVVRHDEGLAADLGKWRGLADRLEDRLEGVDARERIQKARAALDAEAAPLESAGFCLVDPGLVLAGLDLLEFPKEARSLPAGLEWAGASSPPSSTLAVNSGGASQGAETGISRKAAGVFSSEGS